MKVVAIVQARMGSTRLPGKVLRTLAGQPVLGHVIERLRPATMLDDIVIATTTEQRDTDVAEHAERLGTIVFRGDEQDVLDRFYSAAKISAADTVVRITADCPLIDPDIVDTMVEEFRRSSATADAVDYFSNTQKRTFPLGLDTEIFTYSALKTAHREARRPEEREHVTPYLYRHPKQFRLKNHVMEPNLSNCRWTLDTPEDWLFLEQVFNTLYRPGRVFRMNEVLEFLSRNPSVANINRNVVQKNVPT